MIITNHTSGKMNDISWKVFYAVREITWRPGPEIERYIEKIDDVYFSQLQGAAGPHAKNLACDIVVKPVVFMPLISALIFQKLKCNVYLHCASDNMHIHVDDDFSNHKAIYAIEEADGKTLHKISINNIDNDLSYFNISNTAWEAITDVFKIYPLFESQNRSLYDITKTIMLYNAGILSGSFTDGIIQEGEKILFVGLAIYFTVKFLLKKK